jgi:PAT family beta-lactamase induction signal transducer AmpG
MQLGFVLFKYISGTIQLALGYQKFFIWVLLSAIPVAVLSQLIPMVSRAAKTEAAAPAQEPAAAS